VSKINCIYATIANQAVQPANIGVDLLPNDKDEATVKEDNLLD